MTALIVCRDARLKELLERHLKPMGFDIRQQPDPVGLITRMEPHDPALVLVHAGDFPRHWKPLLRSVRETRGKDQCIFIVVKGPDFPFEEAAKANFLGANGILDADLPEKELVNRLEELFRRYRAVNDQRKFQRLIPTPRDRLQLLFTHPGTMVMVTGRLIEISIQGAGFRPVARAMTAGLQRGMELPYCSMRVGEALTSLSARLTRADAQGEIGLQFKSFASGGHHALFQYIQKRSERSLQQALKPES